MNWVDFVVLVFIAILIYAGWSRGFIGELFDLMIIILGNGITLMIYYYPANFLYHTLGLNFKWIYIVVYVIILIPIAIVFFELGQYIHKSFIQSIPIYIYRALGGFLGIIKANLLGFLILLLLSTNPMPPQTVKTLKQSFMITWVQSSDAIIEDIVVAFAPKNIGISAQKAIKNSIFKNKEIPEIKQGTK